MIKYIIIFLGLLIVAGCTPQPIPGPDGAQGPPGPKGESGESGEAVSYTHLTLPTILLV